MYDKLNVNNTLLSQEEVERQMITLQAHIPFTKLQTKNSTMKPITRGITHFHQHGLVRQAISKTNSSTPKTIDQTKEGYQRVIKYDDN